MATIYPTNIEEKGLDCVSCCAIETDCLTCEEVTCLNLFVTYAMNCNKSIETPHTSTQVYLATEVLMGFANNGTFERPYIYGADEPTVTYGRSYIAAAIEKWAVDASTLQAHYTETVRVLDPYVKSFFGEKYDCEENGAACDALICLMYTLHSFATGDFNSLEEWANGGLYGVCYQDCNGADIIVGE